MADTQIIDIEQEFVNHLAHRDSLEHILKDGVSGELLLTPRARSVYQFVKHHFSTTGKTPTERILKTEFPNMDFEAREAPIEYVVERLRHRYQKNKVSDLVMELANRVERPEDAMKYLHGQVLDIERNSLSQSQIWTPDDAGLFLMELQQQVMEGHFKGTTIGYKEIDDFTGGIKNGNVAYLLARPKRTKTFQINMAFIAQAIDGRCPFLFALENTSHEMMQRISCILSGFPWDKMQKGDFMPQDWKLMDKVWKDFQQKYKFFIETPPLDERTVPAMVLKADKVGAESLIFSQFKYINGLKDFYRAEHEQAAEVAIDLKRAATRPGAERPFLIEAQFNRGGDSMEELSDFDAGKVGLTDMIPQSADALYGLFQSKEMRSRNTVEFGILEARNHDKGAWLIETEFKARTEFRLVPGSHH